MKPLEVRAKRLVLVSVSLERLLVMSMQLRIVEVSEQPVFRDQLGDLPVQPIALFPESLSFGFPIDFH